MANSTINIERSADQSLVYIRVTGTIDETFEGVKAASKLRADANIVVLNCSGINKITSFGIRGWGEFIAELERRRLELYYVEGSPKFVHELNQVVHFASHGRVLSFYAPLLCSECNSNRSILIRLDQEPDTVRQRKLPDYSCLVCGNARMELDEEPSAFFPGLDPHIEGTISKELQSFLEARLGYESKHERQLQIQKVVEGTTTVILLAGTLDAGMDGRGLADGLEGDVVVNLSGVIHVQRGGLKAWSEFLGNAVRRANRVWIQGSPALVVERVEDDPSGAASVISVQIPYHCHSCDLTEFSSLSLAGREGDRIRAGEPPAGKCSTCGKQSAPMVGARMLERLQGLPEPTIPGSVTKATKKAIKRVEAARKATRARVTREGGKSATPWVAVAAGVLVIGGGLAALGATMLLRSTETKPVVAVPVPQQPGQGPSKRPPWIASDTPSSSFCTDIGRLVRCVGVSSYQKARDAAEREGFESALEGFAHFTLLNERDPIISKQRAAYTKVRAAAIEALEQAQIEKSGKSSEALLKVRDAKSRVAKLLRQQTVPGAPSQRSDWWWEEYDVQGSTGTEYLVFVRLDVSQSEAKAFATHYKTAIKGAGANLHAVAPGMAWLFDPEGRGGKFVARVDEKGALGRAGAKVGDILLAPPEVLATAEDLETELNSPSQSDPGLVFRRGKQYELEQKLQ